MTRGAWSSGSRLLTAGLVFMVTVTAFEELAVPTVLPATLEEFGGLALYGWAFAGFFLAQLVGITVAGRRPIGADRSRRCWSVRCSSPSGCWYPAWRSGWSGSWWAA